MMRLKALLPPHCQPIFVTDAGFRATWFKLLDSMQCTWIGRIRNRDMVRPASGEEDWVGCKSLYARATDSPRDLGHYHYVRRNGVPCRLVLIKKKPQGRHHRTVHQKITRSARSKKQARAQTEPWLLAVSPRLASLSARAVVAIYSGRMQIEQTFRDAKNARWGLGLSESQSRKPQRLAMLLMIGTLACYALWLIGTAVKQSGYRVEFGSRKKAASALSIISLARWWLAENRTDRLTWRQIHAALTLLRAKASDIGI
jgi:hypothetical protein